MRYQKCKLSFIKALLNGHMHKKLAKNESLIQFPTVNCYFEGGLNNSCWGTCEKVYQQDAIELDETIP